MHFLRVLYKVIFLGLIVFTICPSICHADVVSQNVQEMSDRIMSPFCPGRTLSACPSSEARNLRDEIGEQFAQGKTKEEIEQSLVASYGREVLGYPETSGVGLLGWGLPLVIVLLGLGAVFLMLKRMTKMGASASPASSELLD